jgi:lysophospholipase L1-like esterase
MHIVLLGDSVFDNQSYVGNSPDVRTQLQQLLPPEDKVTLLAMDGSVIESIPAQLKRLPHNATHLVLSIGGNNLLGQMHELSDRVETVAEAMEKVTRSVETFRQRYHQMLTALLAHQLPTTLCTLYNPRFPEAVMRRIAATTLNVFNDALIQEAALAGLPLIDLRLVCDEDTDFANPIEPSAQGGEKIARTIHEVVSTHDFTQKRVAIYFYV